MIEPVNGLYTARDLDVYEGTNVRELFEVQDADTKFVLSNDRVDTNSIRVYVKDNVDSDSFAQEYVVTDSIFNVDSEAKVFYIQASTDDKYEVTFGQNSFGNQPIRGNLIEVEYRITAGENGNGAKNFSSADAISGFTAVVTTVSPAEGGNERETNESIKFFAPKSIQVQDRAVTERDYEILLKNNFSEIQAVSVFGGEELEPPRYGRVVIAVDVKNAEGVSNGNKEKYKTFLEERTPIGIEPIVISPLFMFLSIESAVSYNVDTTDLAAADIENLVEDAIQQYSDDTLSDFKKTFRKSKFSAAVDGAESNILSNDTEVLAIIPVNPELGVSYSVKLDFNNELVQEQTLLDTDDLSRYRYGVKSSLFVHEGSSGFIQDDGTGKLNILRSTGTGFVYLKRSVGTVDYATGEITLTNIVVDSFAGSEIQILGRVISDNITAPKDRILTIRESDVAVTVTGTKP